MSSYARHDEMYFNCTNLGNVENPSGFGCDYQKVKKEDYG